MKKGNYDLSVEVMQVYHDEWCKSNTNKGRKSDLCNCDPLIKIVKTDNSVEHISAALGIKPENE